MQQLSQPGLKQLPPAGIQHYPASQELLRHYSDKNNAHNYDSDNDDDDDDDDNNCDNNNNNSDENDKQ
ncbi:hypothetical protein AWZ03_010720 [Drosophila navojoa]|uniref:Uncharacterized protein n=1 Tax=Drosophila navojoa TaxID=7232 RepID=A0A484B2K6_DRONA|nr:hypothetical protein AWZ03_010720 [Drosophila navojoa]